jgi:hypothetical protein
VLAVEEVDELQQLVLPLGGGGCDLLQLKVPRFPDPP